MQNKVYPKIVVKGSSGQDPKVLRDGDDFYMLNDGCTFFPGFPVLHSTDLIHWEHISDAVSDCQWAKEAGLDAVDNPYGFWAGALFKHNGKYYVFVDFAYHESKEEGAIEGPIAVYVTSADTPYGPWETPWHLISTKHGIDPSFFCDDDGSCYLFIKNDVLKSPEIVAYRIADDCRSVIDGPFSLWEGHKQGCSEGPFMFKKDGYYYLTISEGGTGFYHRTNMARSKNILGPYEANPHNPLLHENDFTLPLQKLGAATFTYDNSGRWWALHHCGRPLRDEKGDMYCPIGREGCLSPMEWTEDGWMKGDLGPDGYKGLPDLPQSDFAMSNTDEFNGGKLSNNWVYYRTPDYSLFDLNKRKGWLRIKADGIPFEERLCKSRIFVFAKDFKYEASTYFEANLGDESRAGITLFYDDRNYMTFALTQNGMLLVEERICGNNKRLYETEAPKTDGIELKIKVDNQITRLAYCIDNKETELDFSYNTLLISDEAVMKDGGGYSGAKVGIFVSGKDSFADFDYFRYMEK